jgi:hypothetical protein
LAIQAKNSSNGRDIKECKWQRYNTQDAMILWYNFVSWWPKAFQSAPVSEYLKEDRKGLKYR